MQFADVRRRTATVNLHGRRADDGIVLRQFDSGYVHGSGIAVDDIAWEGFLNG